MNIQLVKLTSPRHSFASLALAAAIAGVLSGCSGGNAISTDKTLSGTLLDSSKAPVASAKAVFDSGTPGELTTFTSSTGAYTFHIPVSSITGSDNVTFYNAAGDLIDIERIALVKNTDAVTQTATSPTVPPTPPPTL